MNTKNEVLQNCTVEGLIVKLPNVQLERKLYQDVAKALELIGGKWKGGKIFGFVFAEDPTDLLRQISNGESRNIKKEFQFFATPPAIAAHLVELADIKPDDIILEPSAGQGAIIEAILGKYPKANITAVELMELNCNILIKKGYNVEKADFITTPFQPVVAKIITNPPFSNKLDIDHIRRRHEVCIPGGGRIVSIASKHWQGAGNRKEVDFKNWLDSIDSQVYEIEAGAFKESGTMIRSVIIVINKG